MFETRNRARPARSEEETAPVVVYGTRWCAATQMVRRYLDRIGIPYLFRDMDRDQAAADRVRWWTGGSLSHPTVAIGGDVLVEPSIEELESALAEHELL